MASKWIETEDARQRLRSDGILELRHKDGGYESLETAQAHIRIINELLQGNGPAPLLVVAGGLKGQAADARQFLTQSDEVAAAVARVAVVMRTPVSRVLAAVFGRLDKPRMPVSYFGDEEGALAWLREPQP
jgi:hypothetical protein